MCFETPLDLGRHCRGFVAADNCIILVIVFEKGKIEIRRVQGSITRISGKWKGKYVSRQQTWNQGGGTEFVSISERRK